jgi:hypothetical protein
MIEERHRDVCEQFEAQVSLLTQQLVHQENKLAAVVEQKDIEGRQVCMYVGM